jgi:hypothetical protein
VALEIGMHALRSGLSVRDYADRAGRSKSAVQFERQAAQVAMAVSTSVDSDKARHLAEPHAAPALLWPALVSALVAHDSGSAAGASLPSRVSGTGRYGERILRAGGRQGLAAHEFGLIGVR